MAAFPPDSALVQRILPSPNHGERRGAPWLDCIILHYTGLPTLDEALNTLSDPAAEVSCHYVVDEAGAVIQMVAESARAWHAGVSSGRASAM